MGLYDNLGDKLFCSRAGSYTSAASNVLHVTRLRKRYFHSSQRVDSVDINYYRATQRFITARCYASAVLAMALCLSVRLSVCRHKSVFY